MYERSTAFMRDWYRGPVSRKNSNTSESTRSEIGTFAAGITGTASSQKSCGRSRSSSGEDRLMSASDVRRSLASFARPCVGTALRREDFAIGLALMATTHSGRNDSSNDLAILSPIGIDHRERNPVGYAERDPPNLTVVLACVDALESRAREDRGGEGEIESSLRKIPLALLGIPREAHPTNIRAYIHAHNRLWSRLTPYSLAEKFQHS
jgi:hypothetical protein